MATKPQTTKTFAITTTSALAGYDEGATLSKRSDVVAYMRAVVNGDDEVDSTANLDDDAVYAACVSIKGDNADAEMQRLTAIIEANNSAAGDETDDKEPKGDRSPAPGNVVPLKSVSAAKRESTVELLAARVDNDGAFMDLLESTAISKETLQASPRVIMEYLRDKYGSEEMNGWPVPGTSDKRDDENYSDNPDYFQRPSKRKGSAGASKATASWVDLFAEGFKLIRDYRSEIERAVNGSKATPQTMTVASADAIKAKLEGRINTIRAKVRLALALHHNLVAAEGYPAIKLEWITERQPVLDGEGNPVIDPKSKRAKTELVPTTAERCIWIIDPEAAKESEKFWGPFSIQSFCSFNFKIATDNGGTLESLMDTVARDPKTGYGWSLGDDVDEAVYAIEELNVFFSHAGNRKAFQVGHVLDETPENDAVLVSLDGFADWAISVVSAHRDRIERIKDAGKKALTAGQTAKAS